MIFHKAVTPILLIMIIFLFPILTLGQTADSSYESLWKIIQTDTISKGKRIQYLNLYIHKAQQEKNSLKEYQGLEKKVFLISESKALSLTEDLVNIGKKIKNDSLIERALLIKSSFLYANRDFKHALNYSIEAEEYNLKSNNQYNLNSTRIDIGNIYFHSRDYQKALSYFLKAKDYFQHKKDYNHIRGYINSLYCLNRTYWQLKNIDSLSSTIKESEQNIELLKSNHKALENAYLNYVKGGLSFLQNNYVLAQQNFEKALPFIQESEDFTNEHVIYLYLGKIAWQQNQKQKAIDYFIKIDELFKTKKFLNYELRETYDYLIAYYKETNQPKLQLQATENLIALNQQFEKEQQNITNTLHYELETKKLEYDRDTLQKQLKINQNTFSFWIIILGTTLLLLTFYSYWQYIQKKKSRQSFNNLLNEILANEQQYPNFSLKREKDKSAVSKDFQDTSKELSFTEQRLLNELDRFEKEKRYLNPIKLDDLAESLGTNRNTLSKILNTHKEGFSSYINKLRIQQALTDLTHKSNLRKHSMQELAEMYGFSNSKTFTNQFKSETGLTPSYFIEQLELNDIKKGNEHNSQTHNK